MDQLTNRVPADFVWPTVGHPGPVPLWALVPTPGQPRLDFDDLELDGLAETMKKENKGRQREICKVRALSAEEKGSEKFLASARYMIKSGERRFRAARRAGLEMLLVWVEEYDSEEEEDVDTFMLNECRVSLTYYENATWLADKAAKYGWTTQAEIAKRLGKDVMWVSDHMAFSKLLPAIRERMNPKLVPNENDRYKRETAVFFARFDKEVQLDLHTHMPATCKTIPAQIGWMNQYLTGKGIAVPMRGREPRKIRELVGYYADYAERKAAAFLAASDFDRLFENAPPQQVSDILDKLTDAAREFNGLLQKVRELAGVEIEEEKKVAPAAPNPPVVRPQPPSVSHNPLVQRVHQHGQRLAALAAAEAVRPAPRPVSAQEKPAQKPNGAPAKVAWRSPPLNYYSRRKGGWVRNITLDRETYLKMFDDVADG